MIKATAAGVGGQMTIVEITEPPGLEGPLHMHHREDEGFWILEGDTSGPGPAVGRGLVAVSDTRRSERDGHCANH